VEYLAQAGISPERLVTNGYAALAVQTVPEATPPGAGIQLIVR